MSDATTTASAELASVEAELAALREQHANINATPGAGRLGSKQHTTRVGAALHRSTQLGQAIQRLEREAEALRNAGSQPANTGGHNAETLTGARFVRTRYGWHEVVRVNRASVKVLAAPGMDDLIPHRKILEARADH